MARNYVIFVRMLKTRQMNADKTDGKIHLLGIKTKGLGKSTIKRLDLLVKKSSAHDSNSFFFVDNQDTTGLIWSQ